MNLDLERFVFVPLGGVGRIGMNLSLYHYKGKWLIIDCGAGFADNHLPGIDIIVADISFIQEIVDDLLGIVLTHAHEDHLGAIQYLWEEISTPANGNCPVFATRFTATFLKAKLTEYGLADTVNIVEIDPNNNLRLGDFSLQFVHMTHSVPETHAIAIHTDQGTVLHTGDWKLDNSPIVGPVSDTEALCKLGRDGVIALVGDSTNVFSEGHSGSEGDIYDTLHRLVSACNNLVGISLFASNVARIETIVRVALSLDRHVVLLGRSLWRITNVAKESGYLEDLPEFLDAKQAAKFPRNKLLVLCTGCQGEPLAASTKLSQGSYPLMQMVAGDTMIFSSKIIPGNEKRIYDMFNDFVRNGIEVITEKLEKSVHVSGHPAREELKQMYKMVNPKLAIPVHGEYIHTHEHAALAAECGVKKTLIVQPGDVIDLVEGIKIAEVHHGYFGIDGNFLHHPEGSVMHARRRLRDAGIVIVTVIINQKGEILKTPSVTAPGVFDAKAEKVLVAKIAKLVSASVKRNKGGKLKSQIESTVKGILKLELNKRPPLVEVQIERL